MKEAKISDERANIVHVKVCESRIRPGETAILNGVTVNLGLRLVDSLYQPDLPFSKADFKEQFPGIYATFIKKTEDGEIWQKDRILKMLLRLDIDGLRLKETKEVDRFWIKLIKEGYFEEIGVSVVAGNNQKFYVYDEMEIAKEKISKNKHKKQCYKIIDSLDTAEKVNVLSLFGKSTKNVNHVSAEAQLLDLADKNPEEFVKITENKKKYSDTIDISLMIEYSILKKQSGSFVYKDITLGVNIQGIIDHLNKAANSELKLHLLDELKQERAKYLYL